MVDVTVLQFFLRSFEVSKYNLLLDFREMRRTPTLTYRAMLNRPIVSFKIGLLQRIG